MASTGGAPVFRIPVAPLPTNAELDPLPMDRIIDIARQSCVQFSSFGSEADNQTVLTMITGVRPPTGEAGSGVIIRMTDNECFVLTNNHVVASTPNPSIKMEQLPDMEGPEGEITTTVCHTDPEADLAVVRVTKPGDVARLRAAGAAAVDIAPGFSVAIGDEVVNAGHGLGRKTFGVHTKITITSFEDMPQLNDGPFGGKWHVALGAFSTNPGNSGGPFFDMYGRLAMLCNAGIPSANNVCYALPSDVILHVVHRLIVPSDHCSTAILDCPTNPIAASDTRLTLEQKLFQRIRPLGMDGMLVKGSATDLDDADAANLPRAGDLLTSITFSDFNLYNIDVHPDRGAAYIQAAADAFRAQHGIEPDVEAAIKELNTTRPLVTVHFAANGRARRMSKDQLPARWNTSIESLDHLFSCLPMGWTFQANVWRLEQARPTMSVTDTIQMLLSVLGNPGGAAAAPTAQEKDEDEGEGGDEEKQNDAVRIMAPDVTRLRTEADKVFQQVQLPPVHYDVDTSGARLPFVNTNYNPGVVKTNMRFGLMVCTPTLNLANMLLPQVAEQGMARKDQFPGIVVFNADIGSPCIRKAQVFHKLAPMAAKNVQVVMGILTSINGTPVRTVDEFTALCDELLHSRIAAGALSSATVPDVDVTNMHDVAALLPPPTRDDIVSIQFLNADTIYMDIRKCGLYDVRTYTTNKSRFASPPPIYVEMDKLRELRNAINIHPAPALPTVQSSPHMQRVYHAMLHKQAYQTHRQMVMTHYAQVAGLLPGATALFPEISAHPLVAHRYKPIVAGTQLDDDMEDLEIDDLENELNLAGAQLEKSASATLEETTLVASGAGAGAGAGAIELDASAAQMGRAAQLRINLAKGSQRRQLMNDVVHSGDPRPVGNSNYARAMQKKWDANEVKDGTCSHNEDVEQRLLAEEARQGLHFDKHTGELALAQETQHRPLPSPMMVGPHTDAAAAAMLLTDMSTRAYHVGKCDTTAASEPTEKAYRVNAVDIPADQLMAARWCPTSHRSCRAPITELSAYVSTAAGPAATPQTEGANKLFFVNMRGGAGEAVAVPTKHQSIGYCTPQWLDIVTDHALVQPVTQGMVDTTGGLMMHEPAADDADATGSCWAYTLRTSPDVRLPFRRSVSVKATRMDAASAIRLHSADETEDTPAVFVGAVHGVPVCATPAFTANNMRFLAHTSRPDVMAVGTQNTLVYANPSTRSIEDALQVLAAAADTPPASGATSLAVSTDDDTGCVCVTNLQAAHAYPFPADPTTFLVVPPADEGDTHLVGIDMAKGTVGTVCTSQLAQGATVAPATRLHAAFTPPGLHIHDHVAVVTNATTGLYYVFSLRHDMDIGIDHASVATAPITRGDNRATHFTNTADAAFHPLEYVATFAFKGHRGAVPKEEGAPTRANSVVVAQRKTLS